MTGQLPAEGHGLRAAAAGLLAAFEGLGAEHQALTAEVEGTTNKERRGTLRRMIQSVTDASSTLTHATALAAQVYGMRAFGIDNQMSKDADGLPYCPLLSLGTSDEKLYETASYVKVAAQRLSEAYEPTRKHPGLATARRPREMRTVLSSLRTALTALCDELVAHGPAEDSADFEASIALLRELESRTCRMVPAQTAGPTAAEVITAILTDPEIARAAAAALERARA
ncbi:hypothetical protein ACFWPV_15515 [Streptomyces uncialis]|uniref:hypothetical protein n=1 Tax=Streptomyces uncialis TaxID=1048205 RepID=UPI003653F66E